jgi:type IV pilus assembly protein PilP
MILRFWLIFIMMLFLMGCRANSDSLPAFVSASHKNAKMNVAPLPELVPFSAQEFIMIQPRVPFLRPVDEVVDDGVRSCWQPNFDRDKSPLESFAISNLVMQGVMGDIDALWAVIAAPDGQLKKIRKGHYIGQNHGQVLNINPRSVVIEEIVSDGKGCWLKRAKVLAMKNNANPIG